VQNGRLVFSPFTSWAFNVLVPFISLQSAIGPPSLQTHSHPHL
jgi:hypothetical protein